jgi:hypothetical protein
MFCIGMKLGLTHKGKNVNWEDLRTGHWRECLVPKGEEHKVIQFYNTTIHNLVLGKHSLLKWSSEESVHVARIGEMKNA